MAHQRAETSEIEVVEFIQLLNAGVTAIDEIAQALFQRFQLQLAGGQLWIAPGGDGTLALQPCSNGRHRPGVVFLLKRHDDRQQLIVKGFAF